MSRVSKISNLESQPIRSTLTLHPREEHLYLASLKTLTSKPKSITQDALMNEYNASNLNSTLVNKCKSRNVPYISGCFVCSTYSTTRPLPPRAISSHMPRLLAEITHHLPCLTKCSILTLVLMTLALSWISLRNISLLLLSRVGRRWIFLLLVPTPISWMPHASFTSPSVVTVVLTLESTPPLTIGGRCASKCWRSFDPP